MFLGYYLSIKSDFVPIKMCSNQDFKKTQAPCFYVMLVIFVILTFFRHQEASTKLKQRECGRVRGGGGGEAPGVAFGRVTNVLFGDIANGVLFGFELSLYSFIFVLCFEYFS